MATRICRILAGTSSRSLTFTTQPEEFSCARATRIQPTFHKRCVLLAITLTNAMRLQTAPFLPPCLRRLRLKDTPLGLEICQRGRWPDLGSGDSSGWHREGGYAGSASSYEVDHKGSCYFTGVAYSDERSPGRRRSQLRFSIPLAPC
jgi:hypothetical protein